MHAVSVTAGAESARVREREREREGGREGERESERATEREGFGVEEEKEQGRATTTPDGLGAI
jgi:hypothetical protein